MLKTPYSQNWLESLYSTSVTCSIDRCLTFYKAGKLSPLPLIRQKENVIAVSEAISSVYVTWSFMSGSFIMEGLKRYFFLYSRQMYGNLARQESKSYMSMTHFLQGSFQFLMLRLCLSAIMNGVMVECLNWAPGAAGSSPMWFWLFVTLVNYWLLRAIINWSCLETYACVHDLRPDIGHRFGEGQLLNNQLVLTFASVHTNTEAWLC